MAKSEETQAQARKRLAKTAGRRVEVFMRKALKLADECNIDPREVFSVFLEVGIPGRFLQEWRKAEGDDEAYNVAIPNVDWDKLIEQLGPMIEKMLEQSAKAK